MSIELVIGPMFSGKTSELMRRVKRWTMAGKQCVVVRYLNDNRYTRQELISSHDQEFMAAVPATDPRLLLPTLLEADVIALDEAQFMAGIVELCDELANAGKTVIVAALDADYRREPFASIVALVAKAERVTKLDAICCCCYGAASFSRRIDATNSVLEDIGGAEKYVSCCRACFGKPISEMHLLRSQENVSRLRLLQSK